MSESYKTFSKHPKIAEEISVILSCGMIMHPFKTNLDTKCDLNTFKGLLVKALKGQGVDKFSSKSRIYLIQKEEFQVLDVPSNLKSGDEIMIYDDSNIDKSLIDISRKLGFMIYIPIFNYLKIIDVSDIKDLVASDEEGRLHKREIIAKYAKVELFDVKRVLHKILDNYK